MRDMYNSKSVSYTTHQDLCSGCGICGSACIKNAISIDNINGTFRPSVDDNICKGCGRCLKTCPGIGVKLNELSSSIFADDGIKEDKYIGRYLQCYKGNSNNPLLREKAASGGVVSQFLIWLLENKKIDGAIVTRFNKDAPLKVCSLIARTKDDVLSAKGSKYTPVSLHDAMAELNATEAGKYVVVGLPCHIQGVRKLMSIDKKLREKIYGTFSLFCSGSQTFNYTEYILKQYGGNVVDLNYLAYRENSPTGMVAKGKGFEFFKEYRKYNVPLKATFYPKRCLLCVDMFGELADVSFGDIHCDDPNEAGSGIDAVIVKSKEWQDLLNEAKAAGAITLNEITTERMLHKRAMAPVKKGRNASFVELLKKLHLPAPEYDSKYNARVNIKIGMRYIVMRTKQFIGNHRCLWFLLPKLK